MITTNIVYLLSVYEGYIPWSIPYIDGSFSISKAARNGSSLFIFRAVMVAYGVLLIWFWIYVRHWLRDLYARSSVLGSTIQWLGIAGALSLILYVDFLGTTGEVNRFMRQFGILIYFMGTPLAQILLLREHYRLLPSLPEGTINPKLLHFQLVVIVSMLLIGIISGAMEIMHLKTDQSENIAEWNLALLMQLYFAVMVPLWKEYQYDLKRK